ncbi:hypothetical protein Ahy_A10g049787 [Arachis hypogaea]|uniref:Aminotransferase-like plant mobile domain-containing protein n=1 Tax=Arachis hypogaea TaxID=3818 RepID=A0A445B7X4_ARAHY|nr:hypothetical protein Ahy_A10g049787 [Arachis hypogaea]
MNVYYRVYISVSMSLKPNVAYILGLPINREAFFVENGIVCFGREPGPQDHVLGKVNIVWVRRCRDTEPCNTQKFVERYVREHIFCMLGIVVFSDKSTTSLNSKFLPLLRNLHRISRYSWGAANLAHLYRSLCRASRYNCKEMDGPLMLLFVWAWERMPLLTLIPRDQLDDVGGVIGADIQDIYGGLLRILGDDSTTWELTILYGGRIWEWGFRMSSLPIWLCAPPSLR